jgi:hypothetical protein
MEIVSGLPVDAWLWEKRVATEAELISERDRAFQILNVRKTAWLFVQFL